MTREEFRIKLLEQIEFALSDMGNENDVLDLRVHKTPYDVIEDYIVLNIEQIDEAYDFIKDAEEWYVDIYENIVGENRAEFSDYALTSWSN